MNNYQQSRVLSPVQLVRSKTNINRKESPVRKEVLRTLGTYELTAVVEEDVQTLATMKHMEGMIAFICTLQKDGRVISQGRGSTVLTAANRYISRAVRSACNSALSDAVIRATKVLDALLPGSMVEAKTGSSESEMATEKQRKYLHELIALNVDDENERERRQSELDELTKQEASQMIASFRQ